MAAPEHDLTKLMRVAEGLWQRRRPDEAVQAKLAKAYSLLNAARRAHDDGREQLAKRLDRSANLALLSAAIHELKDSQHGQELLSQLSDDADTAVAQARGRDSSQGGSSSS